MRISDWSSDVCSSDLTVGLAEVGRDLGHELVRRDPGRSGQPGFLPDRAADRLGGGGGRGQPGAVVADVEVGLVQRPRFDRERKRVVWGKSVSVSGSIGGRRIRKKTKTNAQKHE